MDGVNKKNKIGRDAATLTFAKVITMAISLVSAMLLSRFRTLQEYGTYSQILIVVNLISALFMMGLPNSINFFLSRYETREERKHFLSVYYTLNIIFSLVMGIVIFLSLPLIINYFSNQMLKSFIYVLVLLPWTKVTIDSISNVLVVYGKTLKLTIFNIVNALMVLVAILAVKLFGWSFREYMLLFLLGEVFMSVWVYISVFNLEKSLNVIFDKKLTKYILKYSVPIGVAGLVGTVNLEIDKLMIGKFFDTEVLAIYTNAGKELPFTIIAASLTAVLLPQIARKMKNNEKEEVVNLWGDSVEISYIFVAFFVAGLVVFAPQVMTFLYSEKYLAGVSIFRVYSLVLLLRVTYFGMVLSATGKTKLILYSSVGTLLVNVILNYLFYLTLGVIGPAIATFISIFSAIIFQLIATAKSLKVRFLDILPWLKLIKHSLINIAWSLPLYFLINYFKVGTTNKEIFICIIIAFVIMILYLCIQYKTLRKKWNELNNR